MRVPIAVLAVALSSCAWLFQEHETPAYDRGHEPRCTTTKGWIVLDAVFGGLNLAAASDEITSSHRTTQDNLLLTTAIAWFVVHTASGLMGESWADGCERYRQEYDEQGVAPTNGGGIDSPEARELRRERTEAMKRRALDAGVDAETIDASE